MDIVQDFYDSMASSYDMLFKDWTRETREQALILDRLFKEMGFERGSDLLDCACGIGTQAIGLAELGYHVTASDYSRGELAQAEERARDRGVQIRLEWADFRCLEEVFTDAFDIVIAMDNALPHMLSKEDLETAVKREELTDLLYKAGFGEVLWKFQEETRFYQHIVIGIR